MMADKYATQLRDIPTEPHWAIITQRSTHIPGDERSRTNPGHGYPAYTEYSVNYEVYHTEENWKQSIAERESNKRSEPYVALYVQPATVTKSVEVSVT